jgi:DNA repair protein RadA/Sms
MAKLRSKYVCSECGYESSGWLGKCPSCMKWNTLLEEVYEEPSSQALKTIDKSLPEIMPLSEIEIPETSRIKTGSKELDRVLGGGLVPASLILIGGEPGIGKSTLILQICAQIAKSSRVLYVSGEESVGQIKLRADRLNAVSQSVFMASETSFERIERLIEKEKPDFVVIDSIQTVYSELLSSAPGSVSQVRDVTARLLRISKKNGITVFVVGHVTKEGAIAGPRVLEHMVDTVLYFEGERHQDFRILRAVKNRFGSTNEIGIFEMREKGLIEVENPSEIFLQGRPVNAYGTVVTAAIEGTRPVLIEIQALVTYSPAGFAKRITTGIDNNRAAMLLAVLEKKAGLAMQSSDTFINVTGGLQLKEPAADLAILCALASSFKEIPVDFKTTLIGEVGLTGEIRGVNSIEKRLLEAQKMGFERAVIAQANEQAARELKNIEIISVNNVRQVMDLLF